MHIAVDLDGILTIETSGFGDDVYAKRSPNLKNIKAINQLYKQGHIITIFTARYSLDRAVTISWLKKYNIKYNNIIFDKLKYDAIIDDKAFNSTRRLTQWLQTK
ncbi:MAG TPA: hypothetical protein PK941_11235 [Paludibacter sp.]|nr:hypothetical protein [Paludibacter sp.]